MNPGSKYFLSGFNRMIFCLLYLGAGINHFWHAQGYIDLIPPYFPWHPLLNIVSGVLEITGSILMIIPHTRKYSAILITALLIAFIPAHIYLIQMHGCVSPKMCTTNFIAWVRLPLQVVLIWWAWKTYRTPGQN